LQPRSERAGVSRLRSGHRPLNYLGKRFVPTETDSRATIDRLLELVVIVLGNCPVLSITSIIPIPARRSVVKSEQLRSRFSHECARIHTDKSPVKSWRRAWLNIRCYAIRKSISLRPSRSVMDGSQCPERRAARLRAIARPAKPPKMKKTAPGEKNRIGPIHIAPGGG
jgi:hypothetical protein